MAHALTSPTYVQSLRKTLHDVMDQDPAVVVLGEDILDPYGGAFKVTRGLSTRFPDRVLTTPICEGTIAGASVGLALRGMRPVAELMFGDFATLATDQIINHAAKFPAMYNGQVTVPLVIRMPMGGRRGYGPTHSQSLERLFVGTPHIKVVAPSHFHDAGAMLRAAIYDAEPVIFVENKVLYPQRLRLEATDTLISRESVGAPDSYPTVVLRNYAPTEQPDVTVIAYGGMSYLLAPLMARLVEEEIRVLACMPGCLSPLDETPLLEAARATGRVVVVEENSADFGWGAEVAARIYGACYAQLRAPVVRLGAAPTVIPAAKALEDAALVSDESLLSAIMEVLS
ncbi:MAG TPA: transketolase C-terminal domain-containing protein [Ktedonobacterales bacterium]|nr:transketolase C-terminal domain-containing protein [Ktedonobacterales bacterium]